MGCCIGRGRWKPIGGVPLRAGAPYRTFGRQWICAALVMPAVVAGLPAKAEGGPPQPVRRLLNPIRVPAGQPIQRKSGHVDRAVPVLIEPSAPINNLFQKADEGITRRDWKFVIDSLQRVIDHPERSLVIRSDDGGSKVYESVRRVAFKRLAGLPPEALRAYRVLFDGRARGLLKRGRETHDPALLRTVVDRFLLTSPGDDAAQLLASWMLDAGQPANALQLLAEFGQLVPDADVPQHQTDLLRAVCLTLTGNNQEAEALLVAREEAEAGTLGPKTDWQQVRTALADASLRDMGETGRATAAQAWPARGGTPSHIGIMASTRPTLSGATPWDYRFSTTGFDAPGAAVNGGAHVGLRPSLGTLVASAERVFIRNPKSVVALDADSMTPIWEVAFAHHAPRVPERQPVNRTIRPGSPPQSSIDQAAWSISTGGGLLYVLQRESDPNGGRAPARRGQRLGRLAEVHPTWLTALDQQSGVVRWQRGRNEAPSDPLANVEFRATPILVEGSLWIPYQRQRDLYMAVLDPKTGSLIHSSLLCTLPSTTAPGWMPLTPAYGDGVVLVPTGEGVLLAIDQAKPALRWANQYAESTSLADRPARERPAHRLVSPPVYARGRVFLAPARHDEILAFSAINGDLLWRVPIGESAHIVACRDGRLYLGGRELACLSVKNGERLWTTDVQGVPTGRTILAGDVLYTPTFDVLVSVDAETGRLIANEAVPEEHNPLGNLLCIHDSMYALDAHGVKRFPDVSRAYPRALAAYNENPGDLGAGVRLGWMELLLGRPEQALSIVESHESSENKEAPAGPEAFLKRLKMESLLALASRSAYPAQQRIGYLKEAGESALTDKERIRCGLALSRTRASLGLIDEAYHGLLDLGMQDMTASTSTTAGAVHAATRLEIKHRLSVLARDLSKSDRAAIESKVRGLIRDAIQTLQRQEHDRDAVKTLLAVVELDPPGRGTTDALFELSDLLAMDQRREQAEQYLLAGERVADSDDDVITAMMRNYEAYTELPGGQNAGRDILDRLAVQFGGTRLPRDSARSVQDWIDDQRKSLAYTDASVTDLATPDNTARPSEGFTGKLTWPPILPVRSSNQTPQRQRRANSADALLSFARATGPLLEDRVLTIGSGSEVRCLRLNDGHLLWKTRIGVSTRPGATLESSVTRGGIAPYWAVADGQTVVIQGDDGLHAVGLLTGKRIWSVPYRRAYLPGSITRDEVVFALGDGFLVGTPRSNLLTKASLIDGAPLWERELRGERIGHIQIVGETIVTSDPNHQRVHLLRAEDGSLIQLVLFRQPDPDSGPIKIVVGEKTVCGAVASPTEDRVVAISLRTGEVAWEKSFPKPVAQLFTPDRSVIGVNLLGGDIVLLDADTGATRFDANVRGVHRRIVDAVVSGNLLILRHPSPRFGTVSLTAVDLASEDVIWTRGGLAPRDAARYDLEIVDGTAAVIVQSKTNRGRAAGLSAILIDVTDGQDAGLQVDLAYMGRRGWRAVEVQRRHGSVVVGTPQAIIPIEVGVAAQKAGDS